MARKRSKAAIEASRRRLAWTLGALCVLCLVVLLVLTERGGESEGEKGTPSGTQPAGTSAPPGGRAELPSGQTEGRESTRGGYDEPAPTGPEQPERRARPARSEAAPRIAIVIDDVGHSMEPVDDLLDIGLPLTYAVIPHLSYSREASRKLSTQGQEVILHQPMEAIEYPAVPLEEGGLLVGMLGSEVERILSSNLESVPDARGVNNHKGSRATQDSKLMHSFLSAAGSRGLYFLDSRTSAETIAESVARELHVPTARRHVFLDNDNEVESIHRQLRELIALAEKQGSAIGIGHARASMVWALETARPWLADGTVEIVPASELVH